MSEIEHAKHIKTIFCDIDGCILKHHGNLVSLLTSDAETLPGVRETFSEWGKKGYTVILTTGRPESMRVLTTDHIRNAGLFYHSLIMNLPRGARIVINDIKSKDGDDTAVCINLERNIGMENVNI